MQYEVIRSKRKTLSLGIRNAKLVVRAPLHMSDRTIARFVQEHRGWIETQLENARQLAALPKLTEQELCALTERAKKVIPERTAHFAPLVGVTYGRITIRRQRTRWGSCSAAGNLSFNCLLLLAPPEILDSVVVHELCHRREMNHSARFYAEALRVLPDYRQRAAWLKENGKRLLALLP